jgi:hypothetical protein
MATLGDPAGPRTLVVACENELLVVPDLADPAIAYAIAGVSASFPAVRAGDVTGDGLEDLVVRGGTSALGTVGVIAQCSTSFADGCGMSVVPSPMGPPGGP